MVDIHNYKRRLFRTIERIKQSELSEVNKTLLLKFHDNLFIESLSLCKIERYLFDIFRFTFMIKKDLMDASKDDIKSVIAELEKGEWSPHTKHSFKVALRKFYKSIEGPEEKGVYPERIRWLHSNIKVNQEKRPSELISEEEAKQMIAHCKQSRDKALISVLYESGCRISEVGLLKIMDVSFDQYGAILNVTGKTGPRRVRLVTSSYYLKEYINRHETNQNPDSYLWISYYTGKLLNYACFNKIVHSAARKAGMQKRVYPHLFRHSRATFLANKLTEAQMKCYLGWTQSSKMAAVYVHMSGRDTDGAILGLNGIKIQEEDKIRVEFKPVTCLRCKKSYPPTIRFCENCGMILDEGEASKVIQKELEQKEFNIIMENLVKDKELFKDMIDRMKVDKLKAQ